MNVWYPLRSFNLKAKYNLQDTLLDGKACLSWNVRDENKTAELKGRWENPPIGEGSMHNVDLSLSHPSFRKVNIFITLSVSKITVSIKINQKRLYVFDILDITNFFYILIQRCVNRVYIVIGLACWQCRCFMTLCNFVKMKLRVIKVKRTV
jgi:hypothetical protein